MPDLLTALREFRALEHRRATDGLQEADLPRWHELVQLLGPRAQLLAPPPGSAPAMAPSAPPPTTVPPAMAAPPLAPEVPEPPMVEAELVEADQIVEVPPPPSLVPAPALAPPAAVAPIRLDRFPSLATLDELPLSAEAAPGWAPPTPPPEVSSPPLTPPVWPEPSPEAAAPPLPDWGPPAIVSESMPLAPESALPAPPEWPPPAPIPLVAAPLPLVEPPPPEWSPPPAPIPLVAAPLPLVEPPPEWPPPTPIPLVAAPLPLVAAPLPLVAAPLPLVAAPLPLVAAPLPLVEPPPEWPPPTPMPLVTAPLPLVEPVAPPPTDDFDLPSVLPESSVELDRGQLFGELRPPNVLPGEHRVVVHMRAGLLKRGMLQDPDFEASELTLQPPSGGTAPERVPISQVKAVFFMMKPGDPLPDQIGQKLTVEFEDGRRLSGFCDQPHPSAPGFFLVPADTRSNTARIYVLREAIKSIES